MWENLYTLDWDVRDIEAIARSRVSRFMPKRIKNWLYGGFGVFALGLVYWVFNGGWKALGVMVVGAAIAWYSTILVDRLRKSVTGELKRVWRAELKKQEVKP
jgi:hypothetical protein